jgi:hypothetical protein
MVAIKSHGTELTIVMYLFYVLIYDEVDAKFSIKLRIKLRYRENMLVRSQLWDQSNQVWISLSWSNGRPDRGRPFFG